MTTRKMLRYRPPGFGLLNERVIKQKRPLTNQRAFFVDYCVGVSTLNMLVRSSRFRVPKL